MSEDEKMERSCKVRWRKETMSKLNVVSKEVMNLKTSRKKKGGRTSW